MNPPYSVVALMVAVPGVIAVTTPDDVTVAFDEVELHVTDLFVALDGIILAVKVTVFVG